MTRCRIFRCLMLGTALAVAALAVACDDPGADLSPSPAPTSPNATPMPTATRTQAPTPSPSSVAVPALTPGVQLMDTPTPASVPTPPAKATSQPTLQAQIDNLFADHRGNSPFDDHLRKLSDYQSPTPAALSSFETLAAHARQDFELTKRAVIAAGFLGLDSKAANEYTGLVLVHRANNNGFDDPSGFVSTLDICMTLAYLHTPGPITLLDGTKVDRRTHALSTKETKETLLAASDVYALLCLPKSGLNPVPLHLRETNRDYFPLQTIFRGYITFDRSSDIRFGAVNYSDFDQQQLAEMVSKATSMLKSPHKSIIEFFEKRDISIGRVDIEAARKLDPVALDDLVSLSRAARGAKDPEVYALASVLHPLREHHLRNFSVVEHSLAEKVRDLAKGNLTDNPLYLSLDSDYRHFVVAEMDKMITKAQEISTLPVYDRVFAANTHGLYDSHGFIVVDLKNLLVKYTGNSAFRDAGIVDAFGHEYPSLPPEEEMLLYVVGFQHIVYEAVTGKRNYNPESWGFIMTTEGAKIPGGDDQVYYYSKVYQDRRILAMGEPLVVPSDEFTLLPSFFVDGTATEHVWEEEIRFNGSVTKAYGKSFLLAPHFIDEPYDPKIHPIDFKGNMTGYWVEVHNNIRNIPPEREYKWRPEQ